jgi:hypothetical protein
MTVASRMETSARAETRSRLAATADAGVETIV